MYSSSEIRFIAFQFTPAQSQRQTTNIFISDASRISIHSGTKPETVYAWYWKTFGRFQFTPAQSQRRQFYPNTPIINHHFYTKYPIFHLHPLIPLPKQITNHSFISANPSIYLCSLTFRTTLYCFIITPSLQLFQKHFLLFPPQRILFSKIFLIFPVREFSF